jgi:hypothetical protein
MLERYAMKVARTVLRGGSGSNATPLPDHADGGTLSARALRWAMVAVDCSLARSHRQIGLFRGFRFFPFRERVSSRQPPVSPKRVF